MTEFPQELRHYCRNPRCKMKMPVPVESEHRAFCCRGCYEQFYAKHCRVCQVSLPPAAANAWNRKVCKKSKCRNALANNRDAFTWVRPMLPDRSPERPSENPHFTGLSKPPQSWVWAPLSEDGDFELLTGRGRQLARVRREGDLWWVAYPRCHPEPPLESLKAASRRALSLGAGAL